MAKRGDVEVEDAVTVVEEGDVDGVVNDGRIEVCEEDVIDGTHGGDVLVKAGSARILLPIS